MFLEEREKINAWFGRPKYKKWRYALHAIAVALLLLIVAPFILPAGTPWRTMMVIRGCAGVLGISFIIVAALYYYIVYKDYWRSRFTSGRK